MRLSSNAAWVIWLSLVGKIAPNFDQSTTTESGGVNAPLKPENAWYIEQSISSSLSAYSVKWAKLLLSSEIRVSVVWALASAFTACSSSVLWIWCTCPAMCVLAANWPKHSIATRKRWVDF